MAEQGAMITSIIMEEVDSSYIEVEVATTDMVVLEPLRDHDYVSYSNTEPNLKELAKNAKDINPKITTIKLLYSCTICGYATTKRDIFEVHQSVHQEIKSSPGVKYVPCRSCNLSENHEHYKCRHCSFFTKNLSSLRVHMHTHKNTKSFKCFECNFSGRCMKELVKHYKTTKNTFCDVCGFSSHNQEKIKQHKKKHEQLKVYSNHKKDERTYVGNNHVLSVVP